MKYLVCMILMLIALVTLVCACSPQRRLRRLASTHPNDAAEVCARMFPVKESNTVRIRTVRDTFLRPGEVRYVDCDSAVFHRPAAPGVRVLVPVKCPDQLHIVDTVFRDSIVVQESTAALVAERTAANDARVQAAGYKSARNMWIWATVALGAYTIIRWVLRAWLKINLP